MVSRQIEVEIKKHLLGQEKRQRKAKKTTSEVPAHSQANDSLEWCNG